MRIYEVIFIIRPDIPEDETEQIISQMEAIITDGGGTIRKTDRMGRRKLAYLVRRFREGQYVLLDIECGVAAVNELERRLKVIEPVIKYQTVRIDEALKRAKKLQAIRAKRPPSRKMRQAMAATSAPSAPSASTPPASTPPTSAPPASTPSASAPPTSTPPASTPPASAPPAT
jgi:small subunit ribosomal protein S6